MNANGLYSQQCMMKANVTYVERNFLISMKKNKWRESMKLKRCEIKNFRSINSISFEFDQSFKCLVGLNEAGKSNILKALSFLDPDINPGIDDVRDPAHNESPVDESYVHFVFGLSSDETDEVIESVKPKFVYKNQNAVLISRGTSAYTVEEFVRSQNEGLYRANIIDQTKGYSYWSLSSQYQMQNHWKKIPTGWSELAELNQPDARYINIIDYPEFAEDDALEEADAEDVNILIGRVILQIVEKNHPPCIVWKYGSDYLLPGEIVTANFIARPTSCEPLKNMFLLSGHEDINEIITAESSRPNGMRNLLRRVSEITTQHLHNVWPEYGQLRIELNENGSKIEAFIVDEFNVYSLERRSDGFKRFLTFLLMISVKAKSKELKDSLLIVDEPDIALHPSGANYLRKELMEISKSNLVVIATHSIFMIDKERVDRNMIVKKENERTSIISDYSASMLDEEVIFKALGYSLYDILKQRNVVFEGWSDKHVFSQWRKSKDKSRKFGDWKEIGLIHAIGVKDVARVANDLENLDRSYIVLSDSDKPALEFQKKFEGKGKWITYKDLGFQKERTIEDFLNREFVIICIQNVLNDDQLLQPEEFKEDWCFNEIIVQCGKENYMQIDEQKSFAKRVKDQLFNMLSPEKIELERVIDKIKLDEIG